ncbi:MAG: DUF123 domain-containing protein [Kiritimatiellaeota bacterium]|nr:DUF123 domain-containing protein [Kiritimatiellota bacterium]
MTDRVPAVPSHTMPANRTAGVYVLLVRVNRSFRAGIGGREMTFENGWYAYTGRAMAGLAARLARHLRTSQFRHWHVDRLLANGTVADVQVRFTTDPTEECRTAAEVGTWTGARPVPGFGASDCACRSHLFRFVRRPAGSLHAGTVAASLAEIFRCLNQRWDNHALHDRDPFGTLVSCILSLRTQDPVTHAAGQRLFAELRTPQEFAAANPERIAELIFPVGMFRQKSRRLVEIARRILDDFGGRVPAEIDALVALPGVGRKTANLVRSFAFHLPALCVDTHVHRIANRWGLVRSATPDQTECELRSALPETYWIAANPLLVQHGQNICRPLGPRCGECPLVGLCDFGALRQEQAWLEAFVPGAPPHPSLKHFTPEQRTSGRVSGRLSGPKPPSPFSPR